MKNFTFIITLLLPLFVLSNLNAQNVQQTTAYESAKSSSEAVYSSEIFTPVITPLPKLDIAGDKGIQLFNNGPWVNAPGAGPGGSDLSILEDVTLTMSSFGHGFQASASNRVADEFTVSATAWTIDSIIIFGYQTGSTTATSTFTSANLRIWDGSPGTSSNIVWGDITTNRLTNSYWSGVYRVLESDQSGTTRPIFRLVCATPGLMLSNGTYWVDYQTAGSLSSGPWAPPIVILGNSTTGNAVQYTSTGWAAIMDVGTQGLPFIIYGSIGTGITETSSNVSFNIYPNPAKDNLFINSGSLINEMSIINSTGQIVYTATNIPGNTSINISTFKQGIYFVNVTNNEGSYTKRILIN